ncbi:MAG TPA: ATP-binding cassette domain-containing protein, partial [Casimicrobiaceae bacterium]|nr:ATP-binding cassette domain-containing protein [Casimicrobiaceae bacterium]
MARVELTELRKEWAGAVAVAGVDLSIEDGAFIAVLGPSGCGKSTTLLMLAGIYSPTTGEIAFDGARVNDVEARDRNVGIVFQSYALYPNMTVLENVMFPLRFKKVA